MKAKREGWGPREMVLGSTGIRITEEARAASASREEKGNDRRSQSGASITVDMV